MIKNATIKKAYLYKGGVLAFAGVLAVTMFPTNVIVSNADYLSNGVGSETIEIINPDRTVSKGESYNIRVAYFGSDAKVPIGLSETSSYSTYLASLKYGDGTVSAITSSVSVTYKPTGETLKVEDGKLKKNSDADILSAYQSSPTTAVWGTFEATYAGEYAVNYSITITYSQGEETKTRTFSTEYLVTSSITNAYFEFKENTKPILPSVYDISMAKQTVDGQEKLRNVEIPSFELFDENENPVDIADKIVLNDDKGVDGGYVRITATGGKSEPIAVEKIDGKYVIDSKYFDPKLETFAKEGNYTIKFAYYVGNVGNNKDSQFVTSITKTFEVAGSSNPYYTDYGLSLRLDSTAPTSAIRNVATTLPTISGVTSEKTNHANVDVPISYTIQAFRETSTGFDETRADAIVDGEFTPWDDGYYKIVYQAEDFYGNKAELVRYINNVRDTQNPVAFMYDASDVNNYVDSSFEKGLVDEPTHAETAFKSKSSEGNIIVYAVGANDNVKDGIKRQRIIRSSSKEIIVDSYDDANKNYADYNVIFDFNFDTLLASNNNFYLKQKLEQAEVDIQNKEAVMTWLKNNKFLIVADPDNADEKSKTVADGYAQIDVRKAGGKMLGGSSSGITYNVYYNAKDKQGNTNTSTSFAISIVSGELNDTVKPNIVFPTSLKSSYRTGSVVVFDQPTATDDTDERMDVLTQYYFVDANKKQTDPVTLSDKYEISLSDLDKLTKPDEFGQPVKVVIKVQATDDYGNTSEEWKKEIAIVDLQDTKPLAIFSEDVTKYDEAIKQRSSIKLPIIKVYDDNIDYINADVYARRVQFDAEGNRTAEDVVTVTGTQVLDKNFANNLYTLDAGTIIAGYPGHYEVKVVFTDAGDNQVTAFYEYEVASTPIVSNPTVTELPNLKDTECGDVVELGVPSVDYNIDDSNYGIFGVQQDNSNSVLRSNYDIVFAQQPTARYQENLKEENTFVALQEGTFKFQYNVNVSVYNKSKFTTVYDEKSNPRAVVELKETQPTDNIVYQGKDNNLLIYKDPAKNTSSDSQAQTEGTIKFGLYDAAKDSYEIYDLSSQFKFDKTFNLYYHEGSKVTGKFYLYLGDNISLETRGGAKASLVVSSYTSGNNVKFDFGNNQVDESSVSPKTEQALKGDDFKTFFISSNVITLKTVDTTAPVIVSDYNYPAVAKKNDKITIYNVEATDNSRGDDGSQIDTAKSFVRVDYSGGTNVTSDQFSLEEIGSGKEYTLESDGNYTITYYVYDHYNRCNSSKSYSIAVGDCITPTITFKQDAFKTNYELGEILVIDIDSINFEDNIATPEQLIESMEVVVRNTQTNEILPNIFETEEEGDSAAEGLYKYRLSAAGTYRVEVSAKDRVGWVGKATKEFEVSTESEDGTEVYKIVGIVLIVVAVLVLAGVIAYFVISKIRRDRKAKGKTPDNKKASKTKTKTDKKA